MPISVRLQCLLRIKTLCLRKYSIEQKNVALKKNCLLREKTGDQYIAANVNSEIEATFLKVRIVNY